MRLYELPAEVRRIDDLLTESEGELTPEIEAALAALEIEKTAKVDAIGALITESLSESGGIIAEMERLKTRASRLAGRAANLKAYLHRNMDAMGDQKIKGRLFTASVCKNSAPSIRWGGEGEIPRAFRRTVIELDGGAAREAWKAGELPDGFVVTVGTHLRIG